MHWEERIAFLLSFAVYINSQAETTEMTRESEPADAEYVTKDDTAASNSILLPKWLHNGELTMRSLTEFMLPHLAVKCFTGLSIKELEQAQKVCKIWQELASEELDKRRKESKIVCHGRFGKLTNEDIEVLQGSPKKCSWRPKLMLLLQSKLTPASPDSKQWFDLVRNLNIINGKCFLIERRGGIFGMALRCGTPAECLNDKLSEMTGCIFPEALLKKFNVDVIFPTLQMLRRIDLSRLYTEARRNMFEQYFDWKAEVPIKLAVVYLRNNFATYVPNGGRSWANFWIKRACCWLRSMSGGEQIRIISVPDICSNQLLAASSKDMAIILFGGDNMFVESFTLKFERLNGAHGPLELRNRKEFRKWKAYVIEKCPQNSQRIAFLNVAIGVLQEDAHRCVKDIFGSNMPLIVLSETSYDLDTLSSTFVIVGFPEY